MPLAEEAKRTPGIFSPSKFARSVVVGIKPFFPLGASLKDILLEMHEWGEKYGGRIPIDEDVTGTVKDSAKGATGRKKHTGRPG